MKVILKIDSSDPAIFDVLLSALQRICYVLIGLGFGYLLAYLS